MTNQEFVDQRIRLMMGSLQIELILAQARINELEGEVTALRETLVQAPEPKPKRNGKDHVSA